MALLQMNSISFLVDLQSEIADQVCHILVNQMTAQSYSPQVVQSEPLNHFFMDLKA